MVHNAKKEHIDFFIVYGLSFFYVVLLCAIYFFITPYQSFKSENESENIVATSTNIFNSHAFDNVQIEGKAYVVYDLKYNQIIASHNETVLLPLASITKIMTAVSATLHAPKEKEITIHKKSIEGAYDLGLENNQTWTLSELLKYTLTFSSNDGAEAIADNLGGRDFFVAQMNSDAKALGLNCLFTDPAGRDFNDNLGGKGGALDVAKLFGVARKSIPEILDATTKKRQTLLVGKEKLRGIPNTNQDIESLSGAEASKTGFTDLAGGNLVVTVDVSIGRPVVIVVLGSTREGRFRDIDTLYKSLRNSLILATNTK